MALRAEEREAHRAADQHHVGDLQEALDHGDLVGHLGAADDRDERPRRVLEDPGERPHLALEQPPGGARQQVGDALGAGVRAVGGAEGVVDVDVGQLRQRARELGVVLGLARLEADVLEQQHLAVVRAARSSAAHLLARRPPARASTGAPVSSRRRAATGAIDSAGSGVPFGRPRWVTRTSRAPLRAQLFDRRQRRADAGVVGDSTASPSVVRCERAR